MKPETKKKNYQMIKRIIFNAMAAAAFGSSLLLFSVFCVADKVVILKINWIKFTVGVIVMLFIIDLYQWIKSEGEEQ